MTEKQVDTLNRAVAPSFIQPHKVDLIQPQAYTLKNNIPFFVLKGGTEELIKIDLCFDAGSKYQQESGIAHACNYLLSSGTSKLSANEIAQKVDYYGAFLEAEISFDYGIISLYTLSRYAFETIPLLLDLLMDAQYPLNELDNFIQNSKEKLKVKLEKSDYIARQTFNSKVFGEEHPYGRTLTLESYQKITREKIINFYQQHYLQKPFTILLSGKVSNEVERLVASTFEQIAGITSIPQRGKIKEESTLGRTFIEKEGALQSSIRIGKVLFNKTHPDFVSFRVMNEIFGGYFGSRLMRNIREDKGYTYGISSSLLSFKDFGIFAIGTDVGTKYTENTLKEIKHEIECMQNDLVDEEELELVKNYMMGTFMSSLENVFSHIEKFKSIYFFGLDYSYYTNYFNTLQSIQAEDIRTSAQKYLNYNSMSEIIVGAINK